MADQLNRFGVFTSIMTEEEITFLEEAFSLFDRNTDGFINAKELGSILNHLGRTKQRPSYTTRHNQ